MLPNIRALLGSALVGVVVMGISACGGGGGSSGPALGQLSFTTNENVALTASVTATGGGQVTFTQTSNPASGKVSGFTPAGAFTYTPNANFTGNDSFGIQAADASGNKTTGTVMITVTVDRAPTASNTVVRADGAALGTINVLQNASDPDKDPLTVTITEQPPLGAGSASVNSDGSVSLSGLGSFKGITRFQYTVTDPSSKSATATAVVFVGTDPFRVAFVADAAGNGSYEVYLTDFTVGDTAPPPVMTAATQGTLRLQGFAIADNGSTIVYRTQDTTSASNTTLSFVKTAAPTHGTAIALPTGTVPVLDTIGRDQFAVSPDGQWIAMIAGQGSSSGLYVVNISQPTVVSAVEPNGVAYATLPKFTLDSKSIYFLGTPCSGASSSCPSGTQAGAHKSLYYASLAAPTQTTLISAASDPASADEIYAFAVSPDQTRIALDANRLGKRGLYVIDPTHPGTEDLISRPTGLNQSITSSTVGLPSGKGGSTTTARVAYSVTAGSDSVTYPAGIYVAEVSTSAPNPRFEVPGSNLTVLGLRPSDDKAVLYSDGAQVTEFLVDVAGTQAVGGGNNAWYDSTGNIVLLNQSVPYDVLASTVRGSFGSTDRVGTTSLALAYNDVSGFDRGVAIIGQGATSGGTTSATLQIANAMHADGTAPPALFNLAPFKSPLNLTSQSSAVVTN